MNPVIDGEEVDERDVINVELPDGTVRRYHRRKMGFDKMTNGHMKNNFIQGAIKYSTVVKGIFGALLAIGGVFWLVNDRIIMPQQERMMQTVISEQVKLVNDRFEKNEDAFRDHLADVASQRLLYPTRVEIKGDMDEIKVLLAEIRARQNGR